MSLDKQVNDIFASWKQQRFVVIDPEFAINGSHYTVILSDISYWADHAESLDKWVQDTHGIRVKGCVVEIDSAANMILFQLRWS